LSATGVVAPAPHRSTIGDSTSTGLPDRDRVEAKVFAHRLKREASAVPTVPNRAVASGTNAFGFACRVERARRHLADCNLRECSSNMQRNRATRPDITQFAASIRSNAPNRFIGSNRARDAGV
jgi:hypothetical protein